MVDEPAGVRLRALQLSDIERVRTWRNDPEIGRYMYSDHEIGDAEHAKWFGAALAGGDRRYWIIELDTKPVGLANVYDIRPEHRRAYWAFYLADPAVRGRGVGSYTEKFVLEFAFRELGLNSLRCEVLATNQAVVAMHQKFGFAVDGILRQFVFKAGEAVDVVTLSLLADEWERGRDDG